MTTPRNRTDRHDALTTTGSFVSIDESILDTTGCQLVEYIATMADDVCDVRMQSRTRVRESNGGLGWSEWATVYTFVGASFPGVGSHRIAAAPFGDQVRLQVRTASGTSAASVAVVGKTFVKGQLAEAAVENMLAVGPDYDDAALEPTLTVTVEAPGVGTGETVAITINGEEVAYETVGLAESEAVVAVGWKAAFDTAMAGPLAGIIEAVSLDTLNVVVGLRKGIELTIENPKGDIVTSSVLALAKPS